MNRRRRHHDTGRSEGWSSILLGFGFDITAQIASYSQLRLRHPSSTIIAKLFGAAPNAYAMSADLQQLERDGPPPRTLAAQPQQPTAAEEEDLEEEDDEEEDEDEPKLKYVKLTGSLTNVYRNGDSTSAFIVAGDKMALGTHNGNVHVLGLPTLKSLRTYHAHSATITSVSIAPTPPPPSPVSVSNSTGAPSPPVPSRLSTASTVTSKSRPQQTQPQAPAIPNTPSNNIYIATSSLDGHVCISSLIDPKDVQLRNFARPVSSVALSPQYRLDRTYLSGGLAGQLILTTGGRAGVTVDANTNSAAAAAGGWLGSIGLAADKGRDEALHQGEGSIKEIKWSLTGKWVVWVNEEGIKIMRSHLKLGSEESEDAWRRIAHAAKPNRKGWEEFAGVWRGRAEWVDEKKLEFDDEAEAEDDQSKSLLNGTTHESPTKPKKRVAKIEKLVVGWGDTAWLLHVREDRTTSPATGRREVGIADIIHKMQFPDCVVSGIALYTPSLLAILAYRILDDNNKPIQQPETQNSTNGSSSKSRRKHRHTALEPQMRLVTIDTGTQEELDDLSISRFETLSAQDYHLCTLYIPPPPPSKTASSDSKEKGALEGIWDVAGGKYANRLFSSGASILSHSSSGGAEASSPPPSTAGVSITPQKKVSADVAAHPNIISPGLKLFIQSPYDCALAIRRDNGDRLKWLVEREMYEEAWKLLDLHPEVAASGAPMEKGSRPGTPGAKGQTGGSLAEFFADEARSLRSSEQKAQAAENEKRRIGERWLQQLVTASQWEEAGRVAGKVLGTGSRWERWVWEFAEADKFDEITPFIPSGADSALPGVVYEVVLGYYVKADPARLKELLDDWDPALGLYDIGTISKAIESRLANDEEDVREGTEDWRLLTECLAKLYLADGKVKEALRCWISVQNAEEAFRLLKEEKVLHGIAEEDVPGLLLLRVTPELMKGDSLRDLDQASEEAVSFLVEEALRDTLMPRSVIEVLERKGYNFKPFLYFYLRGLWHGSRTNTTEEEHRPRRKFDHLRIDQGHALVEDHADLALDLFAEYDRELFMTFLRASSVYSFDKATAICERMQYIPELVYVFSKTGQTKRALMLIIDELGDVQQAIGFAKENPDLWDDLLDYSMDKPYKPPFIRGLLEEVGTAIDPIKLLQRIPEGVEIEGLKQGIQKMMREYDVQVDISEGVARVLRGEVSAGMETLRAGRAKGVRFEVVHETQTEIQLAVKDPPTKVDGGETLPVPKSKAEKDAAKEVKPGHCVGCGEVFHEDEKETLIGFACGHVYHLSCLLRANPATNNPDTIEQLLSQLSNSNDGPDEGYYGRSVGAKMAHAHIIRNAVKGGCQHCVKVDAGN